MTRSTLTHQLRTAVVVASTAGLLALSTGCNDTSEEADPGSGTTQQEQPAGGDDQEDDQEDQDDDQDETGEDDEQDDTGSYGG